MKSIFITTLINELIGIMPISLMQSSYILIYYNFDIYKNIQIQILIALAFAIGSFVLYFIGKYGSIPFLAFFQKYKIFEKMNHKKRLNIRANFFWIILMRAIPFFPAKYVSIGLGVLKYNIFLFFISSWIGIFFRGMIIFYFFKISGQILK
jgi:membrane protein YqaA with SNARE-associated domain